MAKQTLGANLVGTKGTTYDLDEIKKDSRTNSSQALVVQVYEYKFDSSKPLVTQCNPPSPKIGQIWLSKRVDD